MDNNQYPNNNQNPQYNQTQQPQYQAPQYNQPNQPQYQAPVYPQQPMYPQAPMQQPGKGLAVGALICGIVALVLSWMGGLLGIAAGVVGIILSINAKKKGFIGGMNTAGLVMSIIGLALGGLLFFACTLPAACLACGALPAIPYM